MMTLVPILIISIVTAFDIKVISMRWQLMLAETKADSTFGLVVNKEVCKADRGLYPGFLFSVAGFNR